MDKKYYATGGANDPSLPLNVRNNNPGNLRFANQKGASKGEGGFAKFESFEDGIAAMKRQLELDLITRDSTLQEFINKYAPPEENDTSAYLNNMASALGIDPNDKVSKDKIDDLAAAMIVQEGGNVALEQYKNVLPESSVRNAQLSFNIDRTLEPGFTPLKDMTVEDYDRVMPGFLPDEFPNLLPEVVIPADRIQKRKPYYDEIDYTQIPEEYAIRPAGQNPEDFQTSTPLNQLTAEDYARLGIDSDGIANFLADQYEAGLEPDFPTKRANMLEDPAAKTPFVGPPEMSSADPLNPDFVGPPEYVEPTMAKAVGNIDNPDVRPKERRVPNLNNMDYMGLLSSLGTYATRMGPLRSALNEAEQWDQVKYPRYNPALLNATVPKRDVRDAYTTAMSTAGEQGKLDLGALALLATKQAQETSRVEETISNQNAQIRNQAQQLNNQITMQELADTAANKGAAQTMRYQILNDMGKAGEINLREYNMMRNDANVKKMFEQVFGDEFSQYKIST